MPARSKANLKRNRTSTVTMSIFAVIFFGAGVATFYFTFVRPVAGIWQAKGWVATPCQIVSSDLKAHHGDSTTYSIDIVFRYEFNGRQYQADRYDFVSMSSNTFVTKKRAIVRGHPPGKKTTCFVNPAKPEQAVIHRGWGPDLLWGLFPIPFLAVGFGMGLGAMGVFSTPKKRPMSGMAEFTGHRDADQPELDDDVEEPDVPRGSPGPATLDTTSAPLTTLIVSLLVALFWNGIVSLFLGDVISSFRNGKPEWGQTLFMIPFVVIGAGMVVWTVYSFLAVFNPRPHMTASAGAVPLGQSVRFAWHFTGRTSALRRLKIALEGREVAEYRRGTTNYTDKEKFASIPVVDTEDPFQMERGELAVTVPADTMHSFQALSNKIEWTLNVHGEIGLWPDVKAEFPFVILPLPRNPT